MVGGNSFEATDGHGLVFNPDASTRGFTGAIADATENSGEYIRRPIDHVSVGVAALGDEPGVLRDIRMRRTSPLAIYDFVKVIGVPSIGRFHFSSLRDHGR